MKQPFDNGPVIPILTFDSVDRAVPTVAAKWHHTGLGGPLLAAFGLGSVLGAIWYGSRSWRRYRRSRHR